jgi:uncharacterized protein YigE (DUF2233 family)
MTLYEEILQMYPLVSYQDNRRKNGHVELVEESERRALAEGAVYRKCLYRRGDGKDVWVYLAEVAPGAQAEIAVSACPLKTIKPVTAHAAEFEGNVLFAMNASFFHFFNNGDKTPYGIQVMRGVTMAEPGRDKPQYSTFFFAVTKDGKPILTDSDSYYAHWKGKLEYAVGGGLMLIKDGQICLHQIDDQHPRTAVGITEDDRVIFMCCDGRSEKSAGLSHADMIELYLDLGYPMKDMLCLDGGGSTTVVLREEDGSFAVTNEPSGPPSPEWVFAASGPMANMRPVADAILILGK